MLEYSIGARYAATVRSEGGRSPLTQSVEVRTNLSKPVTLAAGEQWAFPAESVDRTLHIRTFTQRGDSKCCEVGRSSYLSETDGIERHVIRYRLAVEDKRDNDWDDNVVTIEMTRRITSAAERAEAEKLAPFTQPPETDG
ncbi:hypothetical protein [Sphingopyxis sp. KK2]|uniref:hypothetical protein n=1 Tax=Sphingopyxis sp. KK2 TaxID=1855727 RepID=UPI00118179B8|nr:hypothetical protein [Sphingopyxis sp. KK2]